MRTIALLLLLAIPAFAEDAITPESLGYKLVWSDDFKLPALDAAKWHTDYAPKVHPLGTNNERAYVIDERCRLMDIDAGLFVSVLGHGEVGRHKQRGGDKRKLICAPV